METSAVATESGKPDWLLDIVKYMDSNLHKEQININNIAAKSDEVVESINKDYDKDGANKLTEEELRQAVLNGTVPTAIAHAGASAS